MAYSVGLFIISWIAFILFADKRRIKELLPTCYLAMILGLMTDLLIQVYPFWGYPALNAYQSLYRHLLDDCGVYFVVTYLFLQTLPNEVNLLSLAKHIFIWSTLAIGIELTFLSSKNMFHGYEWSVGKSYLSDWFLFGIFYLHHRWINEIK